MRIIGRGARSMVPVMAAASLLAALGGCPMREGNDAARLQAFAPIVLGLPRELTIGAGESIVLEATVRGGDGDYRYQWVPVSGLDDPSSSRPVASPSGTTKYTLTVRDGGGRSASASVLVVVRSADGTDVRAPGSSPGSSSSGAQASPPDDGSGRGDGTAGGDSSGNPAHSANKPPTASAGEDQFLYDADNDGKETVTLSATGSGDTDGFITSFRWLKEGVELASGSSATVSLPVATHTITLEVRDNQGATATDDVVVNVYGKLLPNAGHNETLASLIDPSGPTYYGRNDIQLKGSATGGSGNFTYTWTVNGSVIATGATPAPVTLPLGETVVELTVFDTVAAVKETGKITATIFVPAGALTGSAGLSSCAKLGGAPCTDLDMITKIELHPSQPAQSIEANLEYEVLFRDGGIAALAPHVPHKFVARRPGAVLADKIALSAKALAAAGSVKHVWSQDGVIFSTDANPTLPLEIGAHVIRLESTDILVPGVVEVTVVLEAKLYVNPSDFQVIASISNPVPVAIPAGGSVVLLADQTGGDRSYTYSWSPPTGLDDPSSATPLASPAQTTIYTVTIEDGADSSDTATVFVVVDALPPP
jgi:hypothetical protein